MMSENRTKKQTHKLEQETDRQTEIEQHACKQKKNTQKKQNNHCEQTNEQNKHMNKHVNKTNKKKR